MAPIRLTITNLTGYLLLALLAASCFPEHSPPEPNYHPHVLKPGKYVPATGKAVPVDSVKEPGYTPAKGTYTEAAPPEYVPIQRNRKMAGPAKYVPGKVKIFISDSTADPDYVPAEGKKTPAHWPQWEPATPDYHEGRFPFSYLGVEHGLNTGYVFSSLEDSRGNIWLGMALGGVKIWDGTGFLEFTKQEGLQSNWVYSLLEDREGHIWIGTEGAGLSVWDGSSFTHFTKKEGLSHNFVRDLLEDRAGRIWIGTHGGGVNVWDGSGFKAYREEHGLTSDVVYNLMEDSEGRIWIATERGVSIWDGDSFGHLTKAEGLIGNVVRCLMEDHLGRIWMATKEGLAVWDGNGFTWYTTENGLIDNDIWSLLEDRQKRIWIGTHAGGGVNVGDYSSFYYFRETEGLKGNSGRCSLEDRAGNIWIGTFGGGINIWRPTGFSHFTEEEGLSGNNIFQMFEERPGKVWIGTHGSGMNLWDGAGFTRFTMKQGLSSNSIWSFAEGADGSIWMGAYLGGINVWDGKGFTHFSKESGLSDDNVWSLLSTRSGHVWVGTEEGVDRWDGRGFLHFGEEQGLSSHKVRSLMEDSKGRVWMGTEWGGVTVWDGSGLKVFTQEEGLSGESVFGMMESRDGRIWIATDQGLSVWDGAGFTHYTEAEGLSDNHTRRLVQDRQGAIWVTTGDGLNRLRRRKKDSLWIVEYFQKPEGLGEIWIEEMMLDHQSRLWLGTPKGVSRLDLNQLRADTSRPLVTIREMQPFFDFLDWRQVRRALDEGEAPAAGDLQVPLSKVGFDSVAPYTNLPVAPVFPYKMNHLTLHWSGVQMSAPHKVRYSYFLDGKGHSWSPLVREQQIAYQDLRPGRYTFRLRAVGGNGKWSDTASYAFTIRPPWWQAWWAYLLYGLAALLVLAAIRQYEQKRYFVRAEARRLKELDAVKSKFYTNITHEFRTPLTIILGIADHLRGEASEHARAKLRLIKRNGRQLLKLVNQMLDLSKLESGHLQLKLEQGDIISYLKYLMESFHSLGAEKGVRLHFLSDLSELYMDYDPGRLMHVISNLLSNAIKFTPAGKDVYLTVEEIVDSQTLKIRVKDTGVGIPEHKIPLIFNPFYQLDHSFSRQGEGTGIGLTLTQELVNLMGGDISVQSELGQGSVFTVTLPITRKQPPQNALPAALFPAEPSSPDPAAPSSASGEKPLLLIVEDNADMVKYLLASLNPAYRLEVAYNGQQGIEKGIALIPDIIITDVMMPEKDGFELCAELKNHQLTSHIPIIMLTAKVDVEARLAGLRQGADAYLEKPFLQEELEVRLQALLEQRRKLQAHYRARAGISEEEQDIRPSDTAADPEETFLAGVNDILESNLDNHEFTVEQLNQELFHSSASVYRKLTALTGKTPSRYIRAFRLARAKKLLTQTDRSITSIALETGFSTPEYFSRVFKQETGMTPTGYRESSRKH